MTASTRTFSQVDAWMRVSKRVDIVSVCLLLAFVVVAAFAISALHPPRVLENTQPVHVQ